VLKEQTDTIREFSLKTDSSFFNLFAG